MTFSSKYLLAVAFVSESSGLGVDDVIPPDGIDVSRERLNNVCGCAEIAA